MGPPHQRRRADGHHPADAATTISAITKSQDRRQGTAPARRSLSFREWEALVREVPFGRGWTA